MDTFKNFAIAQVSTPPSPPTTGTSLTLTPGATVYLPPVPFTIAVFDGAAYATPINAELVRVTAIVGDTLTGLVRAYEGSTARAIVAGDYVAQTITAQAIADLTNSSNQLAGTLPDARLSANVAMRNAANTFIQNQTLQGGGLVWSLVDPTVPVDARMFWIRNTSQLLVFQALNDAGTVQQGVVTMDHSGVLVAAAGLGATPLNASNLASGTVPDARQSANVALKNADNHFVAQTLASGTGVNDTNSLLTFNNPAAPSNARCWRLINYGDGYLRLESLTDNFAAVQNTLTFGRDGSMASGGPITERARATPLGQWVDVPFNPSNFSATGGTWTIGAAAVIGNRYTLIGKTMIWSLYVSWFSGSNVATGPVTAFSVAVPGGMTCASVAANEVIGAAYYAAAPSTVYMQTAGSTITIQKVGGAAFSAGTTAFGFIATFTFEIS